MSITALINAGIAASLVQNRSSLMAYLSPADLYVGSDDTTLGDGAYAATPYIRPPVTGLLAFLAPLADEYAARAYVRPPITGLLVFLDPIADAYAARAYVRPPITGLLAFLAPLNDQYGAA